MRSPVPHGRSTLERWRLACDAYALSVSADRNAGQEMSAETRERGRAMVRLWARLDSADKDRIIAANVRPEVPRA